MQALVKPQFNLRSRVEVEFMSGLSKSVELLIGSHEAPYAVPYQLVECL